MNAELEAVAEFLTGSQGAAGQLPWRLLRSEDIRVVRQWAAEALSPGSQRRLLRELRRAVNTPGEDLSDGLAPAQLPVTLLRATRPARKDAPGLASRQARLLLDVCRSAGDRMASRDCAVISLMLLAGLRRQEVAGLQRGDFDDAEGRLEVKSRGGRRSVVLAGECLSDVERWLGVRGGASGPLVLAFGANGEMQPRGVTVSAVGALLRRRAWQAGLLGVTPGDLRRRFLWQLRGSGSDFAGRRCRYYVAEDGQAGWALSSLTAV
jgi:integrase